LAHFSSEIADYILYLSGRDRRPITPMQLLKLAYISHGWMLGLYGRPLTWEKAEAWEYGPVLPSIYRDYKRYGGGNINKVLPFAPAGFDEEEASVLNQVWGAYSHYNGIQLSALTHKRGTPWDITRRESGPGAEIPNDLISQHYKILAQRA
jgi:uncharacterized phage-associated protein